MSQLWNRPLLFPYRFPNIEINSEGVNSYSGIKAEEVEGKGKSVFVRNLRIGTIFLYSNIILPAERVSNILRKERENGVGDYLFLAEHSAASESGSTETRPCYFDAHPNHREPLFPDLLIGSEELYNCEFVQLN